MKKYILLACMGFSSVFSAVEPRFEVRHIEGNGVGYNNGYSTLGMFFVANPLRFTPFLDLRGHIFDDGKFAANIGTGVRTFYGDRIYGANVYYDYRRSNYENYSQAGLGLESLGTCWDFRLNGYLPFGDTKSQGFDLGFDRFAGNSLYLVQQFECAMRSANAEVGMHIMKREGFGLYSAASAYYLNEQIGPDTFGGAVRIRGDYNDAIALQLSYSYDGIFRNIVQGEISFRIPLGAKSNHNGKSSSCCMPKNSLCYRALQPVVRNEIIPINRVQQRSVAIDPETSSPYTVWFVDNTSHSAGTFESPYPTLIDAQNASLANDIIYVFPGDRTTAGMDAGISLKDNQRLWGSTLAQTLPTTLGTVNIPALSSGSFADTYPNISLGIVPQITNTSGNVVTLSNNNEISGLYIQNQNGHGITGSSVTGLTVKGSVIQGPTLANAGVNEINLVNPNGTITIDSNLIYPFGNSSSQSNSGIVITSTDIQNASYNIINNDCPANGSFFVATYTDCANITTTIDSNSFNVFNYPVDMTISNSSALAAHSLAINNNTSYTDAGDTGSCFLLTLSEHADVATTMTNNTLDTPYANGITVNMTDNASLDFTFDNNNFFCWLTPISITMADNTDLSATFNNNSIVFDDTGGIVVVASDNAAISKFAVTNNQLQGVLQNFGSTSNDIDISLNNAATASVTIANNGIQAGEYGIALTTNGSSSMTATMSDNVFTHSQLYGTSLTTNSTSTGTWSIKDSTFIATPSGGVLATSNGTSTTTLDFVNNLAAPYQLPNGAATFLFVQNGGSLFHLTESGNTGKITGP